MGEILGGVNASACLVPLWDEGVFWRCELLPPLRRPGHLSAAQMAFSPKFAPLEQICPLGRLETPHPDFSLNAKSLSRSLKGRGKVLWLWLPCDNPQICNV